MSKKTRTCRVTLSEVADMVDATFKGNRDEHGWVAMCANAKGCGCINALLPQDEIEWRQTSGGHLGVVRPHLCHTQYPAECATLKLILAWCGGLATFDSGTAEGIHQTRRRAFRPRAE